jgi:transcriptional regulator with XRE-family HTH domain
VQREYLAKRDRETAADRRAGIRFLVDPAPARSVVTALHDQGMTFQQMADQSGYSSSWFSELARGRRTSGNPVTWIWRENEQAALALQFEEPVTPGAYVSPVGTRRRIQALIAEGFPGSVIGRECGWTQQRVNQLLRVQQRVQGRTALKVRRAYGKMAGADPADFGVNRCIASRCRNIGAANDWATSAFWNDETMDDPNACLDFTGVCGTPFGRIVHDLEDTSACPPCARAPWAVFRGDFLAEHRKARGLSATALERELGLSKGQVSKWEARAYAPRTASLRRVLDHLDLSVEDVYEVQE